LGANLNRLTVPSTARDEATAARRQFPEPFARTTVMAAALAATGLDLAQILRFYIGNPTPAAGEPMERDFDHSQKILLAVELGTAPR
jgi:hypothetical protein